MRSEFELHTVRLEVEQWVSRTLRLSESLFSPVLAPSAGSAYDMLAADLAEENLGRLRDACDFVVRRRRQLLRAEGNQPAIRARGRWLVFIPAFVDFSQLATDQGFVDQADAPAWDLWVDTVAGGDERESTDIKALVSWVPHSLHRRFDLAVEQSVLGALVWAEDPSAGRVLGSECLRRLGI